VLEYRLFDCLIPTIRVETIVVPTTNFVRTKLVIGFASNLGHGPEGVLARRNLSRSLGIPIEITRVVRTPYMVFINPKMTTHVNMTTYTPPMNSIAVGGYIIINARNLGRGYQEPSIVIARIFNNRNGHYVRLNKVVFKYLDFKKNVDPYVHVNMFNYVVKANAKTFEKYIINSFRYTLRNTTSD
jgi:hypothetical protein